uniref:Large ribosomal subunit protein uL5m n=2 Tax=Arundo donax TaxID=35708 RepID=A0A0A9AXE3_ARUDO
MALRFLLRAAARSARGHRLLAGQTSGVPLREAPKGAFAGSGSIAPAAQGLRHYAGLPSPSSIAEVDKAVGNLERSSELDALKPKRTRSTISRKSGEAMMFPLHFHYEDVLRQDLLLKLNHANVMEVPGLFEIRLVPKAASDSRIQIGKLAMEILCGQRFIQTQTGPAGKSSRSNPFMGAEKDSVSALARQSVLRGHGMYNFLVRILTVMSMLDSKVEVKENTIKFFMETEFCEFSPELEDHFEIFEHIRGFNVTVVTSASTKDVTSLLWSGFLLKDEGETN